MLPAGQATALEAALADTQAALVVSRREAAEKVAALEQVRRPTAHPAHASTWVVQLAGPSLAFGLSWSVGSLHAPGFALWLTTENGKPWATAIIESAPYSFPSPYACGLHFPLHYQT